MAAAIAIERELLSGRDYSMAQDSDEALARAALEAAAPILAEHATADATVKTEWGVRYYPDRPDFIWLIGGDEGHEETARSLAARCEQRGQGSALVCRTVTYGRGSRYRKMGDREHANQGDDKRGSAERPVSLLRSTGRHQVHYQERTRARQAARRPHGLLRHAR